MKRSILTRTLAMAAALLMLLCSCITVSTTPAPDDASSQAPASSNPGDAAGEPEAPPAEGDGLLLCSDELIELTAHLHWSDIYVLTDEWIVEQESARLTNVKLKGTASPMESDSIQAFNLMIASKDLPNLVGGRRQDINQYGVEGAFLPLNDLIEEYAPHFKAVLDANPDVRGAITAEDGNIYQIPFIYEDVLSEAWFIRQDWLDKLGLEIPDTVDELHDVLLAFATEDPNGNGRADEVGYFTRASGAETNVLLAPLSLFGVSDYWHLGKDGSVQSGLYTEAYKDAIKNVSQWYAEGLIDKEIFTRGSQARDMLYPEDNGGLTHDWIPSTSGYNPKLEDSIPGFKLVGFLPPVDSNGDRWEVATRDKLNGQGWAISHDNPYPVETIKYMDFWWTPEGRMLTHYGIEGDTYEMVDGKPTFTDKVLNASTPINDYMRRIGGQIEQMGTLHDASYEAFMTDEEGNKAIQLYNSSNVVNVLNRKVGALPFTEAENDIYTSKWPTCRTYMLEQMQKWTFDGSTIDAEFDSYMDNLRSMGMDELVEIHQAAYDRLMGN